MARAPRRARPRRRPQRQRRAPDSAALRGIKQGVGRAVAQAFGAAPLRRRRGGRRNRGNRGMNGFHPCMHDAFHHAHLPLPRPTGPYTVIRTTQMITTVDPLLILGPQIDTDTGKWSNIVGWSILDENKPWSDPNNSRRLAFDSMNNASWSAAQITPSAFSAQIMNPTALQTTSGIVYAGRLRTAFKVRDRKGTTGKANAAQFISYNNPRLLAAAKLAFRGVQVDNVPFNMSELANFTEFDAYANDSTEALGATGADFAGFAPQFIYNPNKINLQDRKSVV